MALIRGSFYKQGMFEQKKVNLKTKNGYSTPDLDQSVYAFR